MVTLTHPVRKAREIGLEHGKNRANWEEITDDNAARYLEASHNCELDVPNSPLSGEYADDYSMADLARDCKLPDLDEFNGTSLQYDFLTDEIATAYEDAFSEAWQEEIERRADYLAD